MRELYLELHVVVNLKKKAKMLQLVSVASL